MRGRPASHVLQGASRLFRRRHTKRSYTREFLLVAAVGGGLYLLLVTGTLGDLAAAFGEYMAERWRPSRDGKRYWRCDTSRQAPCHARLNRRLAGLRSVAAGTDKCRATDGAAYPRVAHRRARC